MPNIDDKKLADYVFQKAAPIVMSRLCDREIIGDKFTLVNEMQSIHDSVTQSLWEHHLRNLAHCVGLEVPTHIDPDVAKNIQAFIDLNKCTY